jgi:xylulokinase
MPLATTPEKILAIDVGTSSVKAAVLSVASAEPLGNIAHVPYEVDHPQPEACEVPPERLWSAISAAAIRATRFEEGIEGVGLSCLAPALVLLDAADRPLLPIWTHMDRRSRSAARQVWADVGEEFLRTTGGRPLPGGMSAVCFRQQHQEDNYLTHRAKSYLHLNGWLGFHLTGEKHFDPANACFTGLFGTLTDRRWSSRWCRYFEIEPDWLPPVVCGSTTIGHVRSAVSADLGVPAGIPVKLGTADTSSAMLAATMRPGDLLHEVGTTQVLAAIADVPVPDVRRLTRLLGVGEAFVHVTHNPVGGTAFEWIRQLCFRDQSEPEFYQSTIPACSRRQTRVALDPAYLGGDRLEIEAHRASFRDLTLATDRFDLLAAVLQALRENHTRARANLGLGDSFDRVILSGGGAEIVRSLLPEYASAKIQTLTEGSLRGVARLFETTH